MQIRRVVLKRVRNFRDFDRSFADAWLGHVPDALLLLGPNGSGKSTLLGVIAQLWQGFADLLLQEFYVELPPDDFLSSAELAAVEVIGCAPEPIWVYSGTSQEAERQFVAAHLTSHRIGPDKYAPPGQAEAIKLGPVDQRPEWFRRWAEVLTENRLGKRADLPNVVYLPGETRQLLPLAERFSVQPEPEEFRWVVRYSPTVSRRGSLQNYLYNLKVVDEVAFEAIVAQVNAFLIGKRLNGFDRRTGNLLVQIEGGDTHPIEELSSGEKQVLLMLATITRWLRSGGIVLIDEPDLHLHVSLATAFVNHLRRMVGAKGGQLIVASHMPELWAEFTESHRVRLGEQEPAR